MLGFYLRYVAFALFPQEAVCLIAHEEADAAGWRTSQSVEFRPVRDIVEDGLQTRLYALKRAEILGFLG